MLDVPAQDDLCRGVAAVSPQSSDTLSVVLVSYHGLVGLATVDRMRSEYMYWPQLCLSMFVVLI